MATEYIERETVKRELLSWAVSINHPEYLIKDDALHIIDSIPAADVAPVRHGRWKEMHYEGGILDGINFDRCYVCGYERVFDDPAIKTVFKYCPNCGAKMDGGDD